MDHDARKTATDVRAHDARVVQARVAHFGDRASKNAREAERVAP
jgi:hypothetical protein